MALSANVAMTYKRDPMELDVELADGIVHVYIGAIINRDSAGYGLLGTDSASDVIFAGIAVEEVNLTAAENTSDGQHLVRILQKGSGASVKLTTTDTITRASIGLSVYVNGDDAVALVGTTTNDILVGVISEFIDANTAMVII